MCKRALALGLAVILGLGLVLIVQAQDAEPITQPTVDAAVSTLLAQTQQAPAHLSATQTVQAALAAALTATAQAPTTAPPASSDGQPAIDPAQVQVAGQSELDLLAGPGQTGAYLAPDGVHVAHLERRQLCIYAGAQQERCIQFGDMPLIDAETIRWSPDSRYLALTEEFFRTFNDPDIWVIDTSDGSFRDLTADTIGRIDIGADTWKQNIDVLPQWLSDNRILFLRYNRLQGSVRSPAVFTIAPDGSDLQQLGVLQVSDPFAVYSLELQGDRLIYGYLASAATPNDGVWISDLDGGNTRQLIHTERDHQPVSVDLSPDGRYVLVGVPGMTFTNQPEDSLVFLVDVEQGAAQLIDPERYVMSAGWAPTGATLIYSVYDPIRTELSGVFVGTPGGSGRVLLSGRYLAATPNLRQGITWTANNVVLLSRSPDSGIVLVQLQT